MTANWREFCYKTTKVITYPAQVTARFVNACPVSARAEAAANRRSGCFFGNSRPLINWISNAPESATGSTYVVLTRATFDRVSTFDVRIDLNW